MKLLSSFILVSSLAFASPQDYGFVYNLQNSIKGNESVLVDVEINSFTGKVAEAVLPPFVAHTNNQALHLTVEQTQKIDDSAAAIQLFGPRIDLVEASTNDWQTAYSWGDHAMVGYLLPADLLPYATTAALVVHTNRIDNPHNVTAVQIGAITAEVDPVANAALTTHINRTDNPHSVTAVQIGALTAELDPVANAKLVIHTNRTDNPHNVTAAQIGALTAELDPVANAALVAHTNRADNPHSVTAIQIGALTAEADPVAGPRLDLIEPETNKWNAAYAWGDHALAGYLLPADLAPYATTQQVAEAAAAIPRDRITTIDGSQWIDATGGVWRVTTSTVPDTSRLVIWHNIPGTPWPSSFMIDPFDTENGYNEFVGFRWFLNLRPAGSVSSSYVQDYETGDTWWAVVDSDPLDYPVTLEKADESSSMIVEYAASTIVTTSRVDGVAWQSDLTAYATTQQVAEAVSGAVTNLNLYAVPVGGGKHELWVKE